MDLNNKQIKWFQHTNANVFKASPNQKVQTEQLKKNFMACFVWMGLNYLIAAEPLRGGSLLFNTKSVDYVQTSKNVHL